MKLHLDTGILKSKIGTLCVFLIFTIRSDLGLGLHFPMPLIHLSLCAAHNRVLLPVLLPKQLERHLITHSDQGKAEQQRVRAEEGPFKQLWQSFRWDILAMWWLPQDLKWPQNPQN